MLTAVLSSAFHVVPGLTIRVSTAPSSIASYSFSSLLSASTFPLINNLWTSAGGARACVDDNRSLMLAIVSVGCTSKLNEMTGFVDLIVSVIDPVVVVAFPQKGYSVVV